jgi:ceramide glucosyltransferase
VGPVSWTLLGLAVFGGIYYVLSTVALAARVRRAEADRTSACPRVSILKPVCGLDARAMDNFRSYLHQDYPDYEVLFGTLHGRDPAVPLLADAVRREPHSMLLIGCNIPGSNDKVRILHNLAENATGEIVVITDADTCVGPGFVERLVAPFDDPKVGVVTCLYRGMEPRSVADCLGAMHMTCSFAPGVAMANLLGGIDFGLGAAVALRREVLEQIGGFTALCNHIADDYQLGHRAARAGWKVRLSSYVVDIRLSGESLADVATREMRWSRTIRANKAWGHAGLALTFGWIYTFAALPTSGFSSTVTACLASLLGLRILTASLGARLMGDTLMPGLMWLVPIRDLMSFGVWISSFFSRTVMWRGRRLEVTSDGKAVVTG